MKLKIEIDLEMLSAVNPELDVAKYLRFIINNILDYGIQDVGTHCIRDKNLLDIGWYSIDNTTNT
jgi:hypothetical protein